METTISFEKNEADKYYQIAFGLSFLEHYKIEKPIIIPAEQLLSICAKAWNVEEGSLSGKLKHNNHKELIKQFTLLWGLSYYSDPCKETEKIIRCNYSSVCRARDLINLRIKDDEVVKTAITKIVQECEVLTRGAGRKALSKVTPNSIANTNDGQQALIGTNGLFDKLDIYQANKIPVRPLEWFKSHNQDFLYVYHIDKSLDLSLCGRTNKQALLLFLSQINGYRFILIKEHDVYGLFHPVCDKCFKKNNCGIRTFQRVSTFWTDNYSCLVPIEGVEMKIDLALLAPLQQSQLQ